MTNKNLGRWLLVTLALVGLVFAAPLASAHGDDPIQSNETAADDLHPSDADAAEWAGWMENHVVEYMGPGASEWMADHMGVTVDEMAQDMADDDRGTYGYYHGASGTYDRGASGTYDRGVYGHGC